LNEVNQYRNFDSQDILVEKLLIFLALTSNINNTLVYHTERDKATESRDRKGRRHCWV